MLNNLEQNFKLSNGSLCNENSDCKSNECLHQICVVSDKNDEDDDKNNINTIINKINEFCFFLFLFSKGRNLIIVVSNLSRTIGTKTPTIIIDCVQIAYSSMVNDLVKIGKRKKLTILSAIIVVVKKKVPFIK